MKIPMKAYKDELLKIAADLGELADPFAAWESIAALKAENERLRALPDIPEGFCWINKPVTVTGGDYTYQGQLLLSFPKDEKNGAIRYIVRDQNRRLFIHNADQCCGLEGER